MFSKHCSKKCWFCFVLLPIRISLRAHLYGELEGALDSVPNTTPSQSGNLMSACFLISPVGTIQTPGIFAISWPINMISISLGQFIGFVQFTINRLRFAIEVLQCSFVGQFPRRTGVIEQCPVYIQCPRYR